MTHTNHRQNLYLLYTNQLTIHHHSNATVISRRLMTTLFTDGVGVIVVIFRCYLVEACKRKAEWLKRKRANQEAVSSTKFCP
jgi:hypothetical protein